MTKYFTNFFHTLIIAGVLFSFSGCGYKADPIYAPSDKQETKQQ